MRLPGIKVFPYFKNKEFSYPFFFLVAVSLFYPLLFLKCIASVSLISMVNFSSVASLSLLALAFIFLNANEVSGAFSENRTPFFLAVIILIPAFAHFFIWEKYSFENLACALSYLAIPFFCYFYANSLEKMLPVYVALLWFANLCHSAFSFFRGSEFSGIAWNRNWNAAFLIAATPFAVYFIYRKLLEKNYSKAAVLFFSSLPLLLSSYIFWKCDSRGGTLSLFLLLLIYIFLKLSGRLKKIFIMAFLFLCLVATFFFCLKGSDRLAELIAEDVRLPLWEGTLHLIKDNAVSGTGPARFESEFSSYVPVEYFLRRNAAVRNEHPHNHFLFFASSFGVFALAAWIFLLAYPLFFFFLNYDNEKNIPVRLLAFALLAMAIHSMFDMIFAEWPTNILSLMILGILWRKIWPYSLEASPSPLWAKAFLRLSGIIFIVLSLALSVRTFLGGIYLRNGIIYAEERKQYERAAASMDRAVSVNKSQMNIYKAAMNSWVKLENHELTLYYLYMLYDTSAPNFAHSSGFIGNILCQKGRLREAIPYLKQDNRHFPMSVSTLHNLFNAYRLLGMSKEAEDTYKRLDIAMKLKGLDMKYLPLILENPEFDIRPDKIPPDSLKEGYAD